MSSFVQDLTPILRSCHFELDPALRRKKLSVNINENVDDFRIDLEDDDENNEEYLDEEEAREEDVEKGIKGEKSYGNHYSILKMFCF